MSGIGLVGCGDGIDMVEVEGTVVQDGEPLQRIMVEFWPESVGPRSIGTTDASGKFTLVTDDGERQGAVVGTHRVILRDLTVLGDKFLGRGGEDVPMGNGKKSRIDLKYTGSNSTPVTQVVESGKKNVLEFEVKQKL